MSQICVSKLDYYWPLTRHACTGNAGNVFPATDFKGNRYQGIPACIATRASHVRQKTPQDTWDRRRGQVTCQVTWLKIWDRKRALGPFSISYLEAQVTRNFSSKSLERSVITPSDLDIQIKISAEYRDMLPRPMLVCQEPGLRPIGRSPGVPDKSSRGLGSMSRYSAQILICFIAYIFLFFFSFLCGFGWELCRTASMHSALCHCPL